MDINNEIKELLRKGSIHIGDRYKVFVAVYIVDGVVHERFAWTGRARYSLFGLVSLLLKKPAIVEYAEMYQKQSPINVCNEDLFLYDSTTQIDLQDDHVVITHETNKLKSIHDIPGRYVTKTSGYTLDDAFEKLLRAQPIRM